MPAELGTEHAVRRSLCCAAEGCRRRHTPPSVRFLGRRVYVGAALVGITALRPGARRAEARALRAWLGVSARTLVRWRRWWRAAFATSGAAARPAGRGPPPVCTVGRGHHARTRFTGDLQAQLIVTLRFLAPITTAASAM
jgi:hypothetical protein